MKQTSEFDEIVTLYVDILDRIRQDPNEERRKERLQKLDGVLNTMILDVRAEGVEK